MDLRVCVFALCCLCSVNGYTDKTISEYVATEGSYIFLNSLLQQNNLKPTLSNTGPYTIFAPQDVAFAKLGQATLNSITSRQMKMILEYHVVEGFVLGPMLTTATDYPTLFGEPLNLEAMNGSILVNNVTTSESTKNDVIVSNGVVHPIDTVLIPPGDILTTDTISQVLLKDDSRFKDFFLALLLADLTTVLDSGEYTVFAPIDTAFGRYYNNLLNPNDPNSQTIYREVMKYHIVPGERRASQLVNGSVYTLQGTSLDIAISDAGVKLDGKANVIDTNVFASNGIIHVIDDILFPSGFMP